MDIALMLTDIVGKENILLDTECGSYNKDWTGKYISTPLAVVKPASTLEVSQVVRACYKNNVAIVPVSGNTGLSGGTSANNAVMLSLERLNKIQKIKPQSRIAVVDAGVILSNLHDAVEEFSLVFPLTFGAKSSSMIGGVLSTNAGGSNVLKYGNTRTLCMGLEVVLPDGRVLDLMSELHKDNTGYDLKNLIIGAEGTLGIITAAVLKLSPKPVAYITAMIATSSLDNALKVLNILQEETGGGVEAFEYMPKNYIETHLTKVPSSRPPFEKLYDFNIMLEIGSTIAGDSISSVTGKSALTENIESCLLYTSPSPRDGLLSRMPSSA